MKTLLVTLVASFAFASAAAAMEAPILIGNYSDNVLDSHLGTRSAEPSGGAVVTGAASISSGQRTGGYGPQITEYEIRSGR